MKTALTFIALTLLLPAVATGQAASVAPGARVRITAPNFGLEKRVTTVTEMRGDSIVVNVKGDSRAIALSDVALLEVSAGKRMRVVPYALLGLGIGAVGGYAVGYSSYDGGSFFSNSPSDEGTWVGAAFGVIGFFTGAVVGVFHRGDRWVPAAARVRASIGATRSGGASFGLSRAF